MPDIEDAGLDIDFDREMAALQGAVAGVGPPPAAAEVVVAGTVVTSDRTVEFLGRNFRIAEKVGLMPMLKFSAHAELRTTDPGAMAAMYEMIRDCIYSGNPGCGECASCKADDEEACAQYDPGDWNEFERHAIDTKAEADDLLDVITKTIELISGRPTEPPSSSSPGRRSTRDASMARSSARGRRGSRR